VTQLVFNALIAGSLAALVSGGLALVYGVLGVFNLALGQMVLIGGYSVWWLYQVVGLPLIVSIGVGMIIGAVVAWLTFELFIAPFYKRHKFLPLVTTIALGMILDGVILLLFEERPRAILPGLKKTFDVFGAYVSIEQIVLISLTVLLLCGLAVILHSTAFGRRIRAVVQHDHAAMSLGIYAPMLHRILFICSGILAACGGIFIGIDQNLSPVLAFPLTIKAYAAIIAGGKGNIWGAIICAYIIAFLEQFLIGINWFGAFSVPAGYQQTVALVFVIFFLLFKPVGIFGGRSRLA
jgi:branched-chain amino acid transport system permease protein